MSLISSIRHKSRQINQSRYRLSGKERHRLPAREQDWRRERRAAVRGGVGDEWAPRARPRRRRTL